jgi:hypothetical protein
MDRTYWKFAGTIIGGSLTLFALSGCWTRSPQYSDQNKMQPGATIQEPSGANYSSTGSQSEGWLPAERPATVSKSERATVQTEHVAPIDNSSAQWQPAAPMRQRNRVMNEPSGSQAEYSTSAKTQYSATAPAQTSVNEGPNSGGKWRPAYDWEATTQPAASSANGWIPGFYTPYANYGGQTIQQSQQYQTQPQSTPSNNSTTP